MFKGFKNCNIYVEGKNIINTSLSIENGKVKQIGDIKSDDLLELPNDLYVIPGFVDKHIHGACNSDFMYATEYDVKNILSGLVKEGTTSVLSTTMTQSDENIIAAIENLGSYIENKNIDEPEILGIHLEGPFISPKHAGAQPLKYIKKCDVEEFKKYQKASNNHIKQVTLAVEENGFELVKYLSENNIVASLGHTDATYKDISSCLDVGLSSVTHTYNAMRPVHHREVGCVGSAFLLDELSCEVICDLIHVSKEAIRLLVKNKPLDKICLITDSIESKYMPDGEYKLGGQKVYVKDEEARLIDGTLAGSTLKMNKAVYNFMTVNNLSMEKAIDCATINPAKLLGVSDRKGSINIGKDADFVVVDKNFNVYMTICKGKIVYQKNK